MKSKVVVLIGRSSTGKSTILNKLVEKYGYHNCVSFTTRPMRTGEVEGRDYYYLSSNEEFDKMFDSGELFEKTEYLVNGEIWKYGIGHDSISDTLTNALIVNPHGLRQLMDSELRDRLRIVEVVTDTDTIINRYWERSEKTDKAKIQLVDRLFKDFEDFNFEAINKLVVEIGYENYIDIHNGEDSSLDDIVDDINYFQSPSFWMNGDSDE